MEIDLRRVAEWMRSASTEELLDRVTVFREDVEPAAFDLFRGELDRRGVPEWAIAEHELVRRERIIQRADGSVVKCWKCPRPAVARARRWWRILRVIPVLPLRMPVCEEHE